MKTIGLTGGVACGKSTFAAILQKMGCTVLDTDQKARQLLEKDLEVRKSVLEKLGTTNRKALREKIFANEKAKRALEEILHPRIGKWVERELKRLRVEERTVPFVFVSVPLLFEAGWQNRFNNNVVVICEEDRQIRRLIQRDKISESLAKNMIRAQMPNEEKAKRADFVIQNNGEIEGLANEADRLLKELSK